MLREQDEANLNVGAMSNRFTLPKGKFSPVNKWL